MYQEFISAGVNAYALGCTDEGLKKELDDMRESGVEIEAMQSFGGTTSLKSKIFSEEVSHKLELFVMAWLLSLITFTSYVIVQKLWLWIVNNFIQLSLKPKFIFVDLCVVEAFVIGKFNHEIVF